MPWHKFLARDAGMEEEENGLLAKGLPLSDLKLESLRLFTIAMVDGRGHVSGEEWDDFVGAGWTQQQALEVVFAVAMKVMSNYTNALAGVPLDEMVKGEV